MHDLPRAVALAALVCSALCTGPTLTAQSGATTLPDLGLPLLEQHGPTLAPLRFDADGSCAATAPRPLDDYWGLSPTHQDMIARLFRLPRQRPVVHGCWQTMPTPQAATVFHAALHGTNDFQPVTRWGATAISGGGLQDGDPTTITYSFVPDGTFIPSGVGEPAAGSNMFAVLNSAFGSATTWQNVIHSAFDRWSELSGVTYVYEPNDDGATHGNAGGFAGVRGDVRIGMKFIDGGNNILAYNAYPNDGDMVLDSADSGFFANASQNYRRFFNVLTHEQGHGLGIAHVCPINNTKLMEPLVSTFYSGPQFDDILSSQRLYGDHLEPNDTIADASDLGQLPNGTTDVTNVCIDGTSDLDQYKFSVPSSKLATISVVPVGSAYLEGPQVGNCSTGTSFNPSQLRNLNVFLFNGAGNQLLTFAATAGVGQTETIPSYALAGGSYSIRVTASGVDTIQPYRLELDIVDNGPVATATSVGAGCGGITWNALTRPILGNTVVQTLTGISNPASSIGLVLLGTVGVPGGIDLQPFGAPGCRVYQQTVDIVTVFPVPSTTMVYTLPIPNDALLIGSTVWTQGGLLVPPGTNALGGITANATELVIGTQ
ncbi:MAG: matrixin family metalloprotease [Planctomycetes bacterium]|nr:matrixin family metalloprotease [Planctomycetota bacterium]